MRLETIRLVNFKNFRDLSLKLHPQFNLIIGRNGAGKTAILDGITRIISEYYHGLKAGDPKGLKVEDIRIFKTLESEERADNVSIEATGMVANQNMRWSIAKRLKGRSRNYETADWIRHIADGINSEVKREGRTEHVDLPLIAFYSTARLWVTGRQDYHTAKKAKIEQKEAALPSRYRGYKNSLQIGTNFREFLIWFRGKEQAAIQKKGEPFQLECVRNVIIQNIPGCTSVYYELDGGNGQTDPPAPF